MRKLVLFALPFAAATCLYVYLLSVPLGLILAAIALGLLLLVRLTKFRLRKQTAIALAGVCAGFLFCVGYGQVFLEPIRDATGQTYEMEATVCDYPIETSYGCSVNGEAWINGRKASILLYLGNECRDLRPGDRVRVQAELRRSDLGRDGETVLYYQGKGISMIAYAREEAAVIRAEHIPLRFWPIAFSQRVRTVLAEVLPADCAGLMQALLTGDKSGIPYTVHSDITMAGLSHTIAISGMHVSMLLAIVMYLTQGKRLLTPLLGIPIIVFFVFATGCSPSVIRAAVMQTILLLAPVLRRENDPPTALCAALMLILLQNPYAITNVSFQLSFAAMAGILLVSNRLYQSVARRKRLRRWLRARPDYVVPDKLKRLPESRMKNVRCWLDYHANKFLWKTRRKVLKFVLGSITMTIGAMVFTTPILALSFGNISLYSLISNVLCLWAISICFTLGIFAALLGLLWLPLGRSLGAVLTVPVRYVLLVARGIARLPYATVPTKGAFVIIGLVFSYLLFALGMVTKKRRLTAVGILVTMVLAVALTALDARPQEFYVTALDVGQGQAIAMLRPGFAALYDCGGSDGDAAGQHAAEYFLSAGVHRLDALILSHYDNDHIGGVPQLLYRLQVDTMYLPDTNVGSPERLGLETLADTYGIRICYVRETTTIGFSDGSLRIFPPVSESSDNNVSLSILFSSGSYDMLATGDMDTYAENLLLHNHLIPDVELYIAGHHGSRSSTGTVLLKAVRPEAVLFSVGSNRYGHPTGEALARAAAAGAELYRTDQCGDITIGR